MKTCRNTLLQSQGKALLTTHHVGTLINACLVIKNKVIILLA